MDEGQERLPSQNQSQILTMNVQDSNCTDTRISLHAYISGSSFLVWHINASYSCTCARLTPITPNPNRQYCGMAFRIFNLRTALALCERSITHRSLQYCHSSSLTIILKMANEGEGIQVREHAYISQLRWCFSSALALVFLLLIGVPMRRTQSLALPWWIGTMRDLPWESYACLPLWTRSQTSRAGTPKSLTKLLLQNGNRKLWNLTGIREYSLVTLPKPCSNMWASLTITPCIIY